MPSLLPSLSSTTTRAKKYTSKPSASSLVTTKTTSSTRGHANPQLQSPLLSLPGEIRHLIYCYAVQAYPDPTRPWTPHNFHYRPGFTHARSISVELLLTCRKVYLEAYLLPVEANVHVIYGCEQSHAPPKWENYLLLSKSRGGKKLTSEQRSSVKSVHIFAQQYWLEDFNGRKGGWRDFCRTWSRDGNNNNETSNPEGRRRWRRRASSLKTDMEQNTSRQNSTVSLTQATTTASSSSNPRMYARGPKHLTLTIRHSDWWYHLLGAASPLAIDPFRAGRPLKRQPSTHTPNTTDSQATTPLNVHNPTNSSKHSTPCDPDSWGSHLSSLPLETFTLELETLVSKRAELEEVVHAARNWRFSVHNGGKVLVLDAPATQRKGWTGSPGRMGLYREQVQQMQGYTPQGGAPNEYFVVELVWRAFRVEDLPRSEDTGDGEGEEGRGEGPLASFVQGGGHADSSRQQQRHPAAGQGTARAVGRDVIPSYWG